VRLGWLGATTTLAKLVIALKFLLPVLYLRFPFAAGWANLLLDSVDGDILVPGGVPEAVYQQVDKAADYVAYVFMLIWGWNTPIRRAVVATFLLRTVGQALFFATGNELALFFFPNLLEPLFLVYVTLARFRGVTGGAAAYARHRTLIWVFICVYKLQDEWVTHVANVDRTSLVRSLFER
jgi:hypothetical protein